jgi:hypothetical protein
MSSFKKINLFTLGSLSACGPSFSLVCREKEDQLIITYLVLSKLVRSCVMSYRWERNDSQCLFSRYNSGIATMLSRVGTATTGTVLIWSSMKLNKQMNLFNCKEPVVTQVLSYRLTVPSFAFANRTKYNGHTGSASGVPRSVPQRTAPKINQKSRRHRLQQEFTDAYHILITYAWSPWNDRMQRLLKTEGENHECSVRSALIVALRIFLMECAKLQATWGLHATMRCTWLFTCILDTQPWTYPSPTVQRNVTHSHTLFIVLCRHYC